MSCTTATGFSFSKQNPALRRYSQRFSVAMAAYVVTILIAAFYASKGHTHGALAYMLATLPGLAVIAILAAIGHYLRDEKDEFLRAIQTEALLWSCGITLAVATSWGFLQMFTDVPRAPLYLIFALFCFVWGVAAAVIPRRYR
jgi:hypothetical protein